MKKKLLKLIPKLKWEEYALHTLTAHVNKKFHLTASKGHYGGANIVNFSIWYTKAPALASHCIYRLFSDTGADELVYEAYAKFNKQRKEEIKEFEETINQLLKT